MNLKIVNISAALILCQTALSNAAAPIISPNGSAYTSVSASSQINGSYPPSNLFSHLNPTVGVELQESDPGQTYAGGLGPHSHYVEFQLDQEYSIASLYYAQRDYQNSHNANVDKVNLMRIWAGDSPFVAANPGTSPDAVVNITHQTDDTFLEYALPNTITGRYFLLHLSNTNPIYAADGSNIRGVIGGSEFRFGEVPEPTSLVLLAGSAVGLLLRRRAR